MGDGWVCGGEGGGESRLYLLWRVMIGLIRKGRCGLGGGFSYEVFFTSWTFVTGRIA